MDVVKLFVTSPLALVLQIGILSIFISIASGQDFCQSLDLTTGSDCIGMADGYYPFNGTTDSYVTCTNGTALVETCDPLHGGPCYDCVGKVCFPEPCTLALPAGTSVDCGDPTSYPDIDSITLDNQSTTTYMSQAVYTCSPGFWFQPGVFNYTSVCQSTGEWLPAPPSCVVVDCGRPTTIPANAGLVYRPIMSTTYQSSITYLCYQGYWAGIFIFDTFSTCQADGTWSSVPDCYLMFACPTPPHMPNANYTRPIPSSALYTCNTGYQFTDGAINHLSICMTASLTWSYVSPCVRDCGQPTATPANAVMVNSTNMSTFYQSNVTYQCNYGYWVANGIFSSISTCQADGTWSTVPDCKASDCSTPPSVPFATFTLNNQQTSIQATATYQCAPGFWYQPGVFTTQSVCQPSGSWSPVSQQCTAVTCGLPPVIANGTTPQATAATVYLSTAKYTCNTGYNFGAGISSTTITCQANGTWSATPTCTLGCGYQPVVDYVQSAPAIVQMAYASNVSYTCITGYYFRPNVATVSISCLQTGNWSAYPTCTVVNCGPPLAPADNLTASITGVVNSTVYNAKVAYTCYPQFFYDKNKTLSTMTSTCQSNGNWSTVPACAYSTCPVAPAIFNGAVSRNSAAYTTYTCNTGYFMSPGIVSSIVTCQANGTWSPSTPVCSAVNCGVPPTVPYSTSSPANVTSSAFRLSVTYTCKPGYLLSPGVLTSTITCQANGLWSAQPSACKPVACGQQPTISNGQPTQIVGASSPAMTNVTYTCKYGYFVRAGVLSQTSTCLNNGFWSVVWNCTAVRCSLPYDRNGYITTRGYNSANLTIGTSLTSTCYYKTYYGANKLTTATKTCQADGTWSPQLYCTYMGTQTRMYGARTSFPFNDLNKMIDGRGILSSVTFYYTATKITGMRTVYGTGTTAQTYMLGTAPSFALSVTVKNTLRWKIVFTSTQLCSISGSGFQVPTLNNVCQVGYPMVDYTDGNYYIDYLFGYCDDYNGNLVGIGFANGG